MKLLRLQATNFAGIRTAALDFGPGLNVLYGPNDLGKSTLVAAIRMALLLPHSSTHCDAYMNWAGTGDPVVELTFETEAQRIWRVRKQFGKSGSSILRESKNGRDFEDAGSGRKVDAVLREILPWGMPEPGGQGGGRGLPESFLATVLLPAQSEVDSLLEKSLRTDPTASGKERIAAALQAVAHDPLFKALLKEAQGWRDRAYTENGSKKRSKGSVLKEAAERVNAMREEKDKLQRIVFESIGAEASLRDLIQRRAERQDALTRANENLARIELLRKQIEARDCAEELVRQTNLEVKRIQSIAFEVAVKEKEVAEANKKATDAEEALVAARAAQAEANSALDLARKASQAEGADSGLSDTVVRQQLELRKASADRATIEAQSRIDAVIGVQAAVDAVRSAELELQALQNKAGIARELAERLTARERGLAIELDRCDQVERVLDFLAAERRVAEVKDQAGRASDLDSRLATALSERALLAGQRVSIQVPSAPEISEMRKLGTQLESARAALNVGLLTTVTPRFRVDLEVRADGNPSDPVSTSEALEVEANSEMDVVIAGIATITVRGGRRESQEKLAAFADRWSKEVAPHLAAAGATDLEDLDAKMGLARELDGSIRAKDSEAEYLRAQLGHYAGAREALTVAMNVEAAARAALGDLPVEVFAADITALGSDPAGALRKQRQRLSKDLQEVRQSAGQTSAEQTLADERVNVHRATLASLVTARDAALAAFSGEAGADRVLAAARKALAEGNAEKAAVADDLSALQSTLKARAENLTRALNVAQQSLAAATVAVERAEIKWTEALTGRAVLEGALIEIRKRRDAEDSAAAATALQTAALRLESLPVPQRRVHEDEVVEALDAANKIRSEIAATELEIERAKGALEQVGGMVARERLHDAMEAFELAEREEKAIELQYEAWKLLLEEMTEADAAQSSNLGQALVPVLSARIQDLTGRQYDRVQLTAELGTEGIVIAGGVRPANRISVGTREQMATLYRLALAEHLRTAIVLDDQLVQSDDERMGWFRSLFTEHAQSLQILVFTCRPNDYLDRKAIVDEGTGMYKDTELGFVRAIDLSRAVHRR